MMRYLSFVLMACVLLTMAACGEATSSQYASAGTIALQQTQPALLEGVSYAIKVEDVDGNSLAGAMVALCQNVEGGTCYMPGLTGEDGMVYFYENVIPVQNEMKVRVLAAEGYDLPMDETGDICYTMIPNGTTQITLVLDKIVN